MNFAQLSNAFTLSRRESQENTENDVCRMLARTGLFYEPCESGYSAARQKMVLVVALSSGL